MNTLTALIRLIPLIVAAILFAACQPVTLPTPEAEPESSAEGQTLEITFASGDLTLPATLTLPAGPGPHPALVTITGSGADNRDNGAASMPDYRPFAQLAESLQPAGIAVLRYEDRRMVAPEGIGAETTVEDLAADAAAALTYLRSRDDIDAGRIGVLGHSLGATVAASLTAAHPGEIAFVVALAGPALDGFETIRAAYAHLPDVLGLPPEQVAGMAEVELRAIELALAEEWGALEEHFAAMMTEQLAGLPEERKPSAEQMAALIGQQARQLVANYRTRQFKSEMTHDPAEAWAQVKVPVLALYAEHETTIFAADHLPALQTALAAAGNGDVSVEVVPGVNHLFLEAESGDPQQWPELDQAMPARVVERIAGWVQAQAAATPQG